MSSSTNVVPTLIEGDRFAVITDNDHTGILWVVSILCLIYSLMIFFIRLEARRKNFGWDDGLAILGTVFASIQYILIFFANKYGLGRSYDTVTAADAETIGKYMHASQVLLFLALGLAKCSVISLCRRLFSSHLRPHRVMCDVAMGLCALWSVASILTIAIDCAPLRMLGYKTDFCHNLVTRWTAVGVLDSITEIAIVVMAFDGLWPLQMSLIRKVQAMSTFILRLIIIVFAALHVKALRNATSATNAGVALTTPYIYLQVELLYSLISASVPALNRWLRNFDTSMGSTWMQTSQVLSMSNSKSGGRSESQAYQLASIDKEMGGSNRLSRVSMMSKNVAKRSSMTAKAGDFVPAGPKYIASTERYSVSHNPESKGRPESTGTNSEEMIIRKDVHWQVQYEHDSPEQQRSR